MEEASLCQRQRPVTLRVASLCSAKASSDFVGLEPQIKNQRKANLSLGIPRQIHNRSRIRRGQFRYAGKQRPLRKSIAERFAALTREERTSGSHSADTGQSHCVWPVFASQRPVPLRGQTKTFEKEHCGEVRCAHERRENFWEPVSAFS